MCAPGEDPEIYQVWTQNQTKQHDWTKWTQKKCPIRDSSDHKGATLSEPTGVSTLFPPIKHMTYFTTFLYVEIHFYRAGGPRSCHWPLVPSGLVARIPYSYCHSLTSHSGWKTEILLQATTGRAHLKSTSLLFLNQHFQMRLKLFCLKRACTLDFVLQFYHYK